jgi:hypothetical protein
MDVKNVSCCLQLLKAICGQGFHIELSTFVCWLILETHAGLTAAKIAATLAFPICAVQRKKNWGMNNESMA